MGVVMALPLDLESLLLPNEPPEELARLNPACTTEFAGKSHLLSTLRNDVVQTDWLRQRAEKIFRQLPGLRPVLRAVKDARNFNGIAFHLIDNNIRQRRKRKLAASGQAAALPSHVRKIFKL